MTHPLEDAKDRDLVNSWPAIQRAARLARDEAIRTGTFIVVERDGVLVEIGADELVREREEQTR